jgi:CHAT domain
MPTYAELRLRIDRGVGRGSYRIVATGPAGEAMGRFKLPFSDLELENFILRVGATRRGRRRVDSPEMELAKGFGAKLFGALFEGDVRELYRSSMSETRGGGGGLRLTLSLTGAPELLQVPWEYLYDHPSFLSISTWTPIVRYLDLPKPRRPLQIELPLRILALVSAPTDAEPIDATQERTKLESALAPLIDIGALKVDWLEEASLRALQRQLRKADYHVFHFIGHGGYDHDADDGVLLFEDEQGRGRRISGIQLGTILADEVSLRLAVLNSCEGARSSLQDPFSGVATSLIEREIPAVIGMQFEITDRAAIVFAGEFYSALADGLPVDSSVAEARKAIYADENDIEWGTPVLFMRVADGRLFDVQAHAPIRAASPEAPRIAVAAVSAPEAEPVAEAPEGREAAEAAEAAAAEAAQREAAEREAAEAAAAEAAAADVAQREAAEAAQREAAEAATAEAAQREAVEAAEREAADVAQREAAEREAAEAAAAEAARREAAETEQREAAEAAAAEAERQRIERETSAEAAAAAERRRAAPDAWVSEEDLLAPDIARPEADAAPEASQSIAETVRATATVAAADVDTSAVGPRTEVFGPWTQVDLARVAGRAALGALFAVLFGDLWLVLFASKDLWTQIQGFLPAVAAAATAMVATLLLAEGLWPSVRVPDGAYYRSIGGNRWVAAAIQGAILGATVGFVVVMLVLTPSDIVSTFLYMAAFTAVGFVIAEWSIERILQRRARS